MNNAGRCPRCGKFLVAEQYKAHTCDFRDVPIRDCKEIILDHMTDCGMNKNGDNVTLGWNLDGILYRLVVCKHKEPHLKIYPPREDATVYPWGVGGRNQYHKYCHARKSGRVGFRLA